LTTCFRVLIVAFGFAGLLLVVGFLTMIKKFQREFSSLYLPQLLFYAAGTSPATHSFVHNYITYFPFIHDIKLGNGMGAGDPYGFFVGLGVGVGAGAHGMTLYPTQTHSGFSGCCLPITHILTRTSFGFLGVLYP
jgi:hypothetical protein